MNDDGLYENEQVTCYYCSGTGDDPDGGDPFCPICGGSGERTVCQHDDDEEDE